jgi:hypothetical protein
MRKEYNLSTGVTSEHEDAPVTWVAPISTYSELRAAAYPSTADQLDDIYHNGVEGWKATIQAVKDTYPKGGN